MDWDGPVCDAVTKREFPQKTTPNIPAAHSTSLVTQHALLLSHLELVASHSFTPWLEVHLTSLRKVLQTGHKSTPLCHTRPSMRTCTRAPLLRLRASHPSKLSLTPPRPAGRPNPNYLWHIRRYLLIIRFPLQRSRRRSAFSVLIVVINDLHQLHHRCVCSQVFSVSSCFLYESLRLDSQTLVGLTWFLRVDLCVFCCWRFYFLFFSAKSFRSRVGAKPVVGGIGVALSFSLFYSNSY